MTTVLDIEMNIRYLHLELRIPYLPTTSHFANKLMHVPPLNLSKWNIHSNNVMSKISYINLFVPNEVQISYPSTQIPREKKVVFNRVALVEEYYIGCHSVDSIVYELLLCLNRIVRIHFGSIVTTAPCIMTYIMLAILTLAYMRVVAIQKIPFFCPFFVCAAVKIKFPIE